MRRSRTNFSRRPSARCILTVRCEPLDARFSGSRARLWSFPDFCRPLVARIRHSPRPTSLGSYARIAVALYDQRYLDVFPYLEDEAQWAAHTIQKERQKALERAKSSFPRSELAALEADIGTDARSADGAKVFVRFGKSKGWFTRLRKDLSGVARVERDGDRATVVTARGTRYPMHRRAGGIWGLTAFTADLADASEKATRDRIRIEGAAADYDAAKPTASSQ